MRWKADKCEGRDFVQMRLETLITVAMQLQLSCVLPEEMMGVDRNDRVRRGSCKSEGLRKQERDRQTEGQREMDKLLLLLRSVQRTWARLRKRHCCWRLICVWRKWREHRGRNHPTGRKRPVEVMAGVEVEGLGSCLIAVCSTHTHTHGHTAPQAIGSHSLSIGGAQRELADWLLVAKHACAHRGYWGSWCKNTLWHATYCGSHEHNSSDKCRPL